MLEVRACQASALTLGCHYSHLVMHEGYITEDLPRPLDNEVNGFL